MARHPICNRWSATGLVATVALLAISSTARAQGPAFGGSRVIVPPTGEAARTTYIGAMGAVARPGVFVADSPFPLLVDIVRQAGGLTEDATGNVRIVRHGRTGQQTFYSPNLEFRLLPGDLLVADTYPGHRSRSQVNNGARPRAAAEIEPTTVQLAFLNVLERPVVLRMHAEHATLAHITRFLDQHETLAKSIQVVETGPHYTRGERSVETQLADGSIVVFDRARIDPSRLPELPAPIGRSAPHGPRTLDDNPSALPVTTLPPSIGPDPRETSDAPATGIDVRDIAARPMAAPGPGIPTTNASLSNSRVTRSPYSNSPGAFANANPLAMGRPLLAGPSFDSADESGTASEAVLDDPAADTFLDARPVTAEALPTVPGSESEIDAANAPAIVVGESTPVSVAKPDVVDESAAANRADRGSLLIVLGVLALAGGLIWFLGRRMPATADDAIESETTLDEIAEVPLRFRLDEGHRTAVGAAHGPTLGRSRLDDLIDGDVELEEEPVTLPESLELFGRPTGERRYRIDAAVEAAPSPSGGDTAGRPGPRRPHFVTRTEHEPVHVASIDAGGDDTIDDGPRDDDALPASAKQHMLDRVLSAVHGASRR